MRSGWKTLIIVTQVIMSALSLSACQSDHGAPPSERPPLPTGEEVVNRYRELEGCHTVRTNIKATVTDQDGTRQDFAITTHQKCVDGAQYTLRQVFSSDDEPPRALLSIEGPGQPVEMVTYLAGFDRFVEVENLGREDPEFGLTIQESLGGFDLYHYRLVGPDAIDQVDTYKVEGRLKPGAGSRFKRMVTYYRQDDGLPVRTELYNIKDELVRVRHYTNWAQIDGHWTVMRTEIDNVQYKKRIVFETIDARYDVDIPDVFFTRENLKKLMTDRS